MLDEIRRGLDLDRSDKAAAMQVFRSVLVEAERLGVDSAYLRWVVAVTHDELGALEMAWEELEKSIAADPLSLPARRSFEIIADRVRAALRAPGRAVDDPSTPRLYAMLIRAGEADLQPVHLRPREAVRLLVEERHQERFPEKPLLHLPVDRVPRGRIALAATADADDRDPGVRVGTADLGPGTRGPRDGAAGRGGLEETTTTEGFHGWN